MMLGKRGRAPMKRTTSMTEFTWDLNGAAADGVYQPLDLNKPYNGGSGGLDHRHMASSAAAAASPRPQRRNTAETGSFLRVCSLCKRRLIPGRDIFMYRGDSAFCSLECRQQQMNQDERKDKCSAASKMEAAAVTQVSATADRVSAV